MAATAFPDRKKHHQAPRTGPVILLRHLGKRNRKDGEVEMKGAKKHMTSQARFTKKRIATTMTASITAASTMFASVMFPTSKSGPIMTRSLRPCHVHNQPGLNEARAESALEKHKY
jgi:hypothetical protein